MNQDELNKILELHAKWLKFEDDGVRADLSNSDLRNVNLHKRNLSYANLSGSDLTGADLSYAYLTGADLSYTTLESTNLNGSSLKSVNLTGAFIKNTSLNGVSTNEYSEFFHPQCPEKGDYIGYKKCRFNRIVELLIPADAKRSSATSRKCRASKAKVLSITNLKGTIDFEMAFSFYDCSFVYRVGEIVEVEDFDEDRWNECSNGIHHFITRDEAVNYEV